MTAIDLLDLTDAHAEETYWQQLEERNAELHFHGQLAWDVIVSAVDAACVELSRTTGAPRSNIIARRTLVVIYHPLEKAIYLAVEFAIMRNRDGEVQEVMVVERKLEPAACAGGVVITPVGAGTCAKMLEWLDVLDLRRMVYLPFAA